MKWTLSSVPRKSAFRIAAFFLLLALTVLPGIGASQLEGRKTVRFIKGMGHGINLGNSLDATGLRNYHPEAGELDYETSWHNPPIRKELFQLFHQTGIRTVRIPVSWGDHMDENGEIAPVWMQRVQEVVDDALGAGLYVILNTHHEAWLDLHTADPEGMESRLEHVWEQIAKRFAAYPDRLLFEGLNEPRAKNTPEEWGGGTPELRDQINRLNQIFVNTVRRSGGKNNSRYLLIAPYCSQPLEQAISTLIIPDRRCVVSVHYYQPYLFCQRSGEPVKWDAAWEAEMQEMFEALAQRFLRSGVPVMVTEFGCVDKGNLQDRIVWTKAFISAANRYGINCIWWDEGANYKLVDRDANQWVYPELVGLLLKRTAGR